jgi:post-segregation antitoxin (ccd killing protein)
LLYLDGDVVEKAKKRITDISTLTEEALKEALEVAITQTAATIYK